MERDEYMIFTMPLHTLPQYIAAHQMAGTLELVKEDKPVHDERNKDLAHLASVRDGRAGVRYRK